MADELGLENDLSQAFADLTDETLKIELLKSWSERSIKWLNQAKKYVDRNKEVLNKLTSGAQKLLAPRKNDLDITALSEMLKQKKIANDLITNSSYTLENGYRLLNEVGEKIRGEELLYSVTVTKTGAAINAGKEATGGVVTVKVPLEIFLEYVNYSSSYRMVLSSSSTIYKMIQAQLKDSSKAGKIEYEEWSEEKIEQYQLFSAQAKGIEERWHKVNEGNILEAFLRFLQSGVTPSSPGDSEYFALIGRAMKVTMSAPDPFWVGGDIANMQVKGLQASVTNLGSLITTITDLLNILMKNKIVADTIKPYVRKSFIPELDKEATQTIEDIEKALLELFSSKFNRNLS